MVERLQTFDEEEDERSEVTNVRIKETLRSERSPERIDDGREDEVLGLLAELNETAVTAIQNDEV